MQKRFPAHYVRQTKEIAHPLDTKRPLARLGGASTNYVDQIFPILDHLPTPGWHFWCHPLTVIWENVHTDDIFRTTYLPYLVNIVCEWPLTPKSGRVRPGHARPRLANWPVAATFGLFKSRTNIKVIWPIGCALIRILIKFESKKCRHEF